MFLFHQKHTPYKTIIYILIFSKNRVQMCVKHPLLKIKSQNQMCVKRKRMQYKYCKKGFDKMNEI